MAGLQRWSQWWRRWPRWWWDDAVVMVVAVMASWRDGEMAGWRDAPVAVATAAVTQGFTYTGNICSRGTGLQYRSTPI